MMVEECHLGILLEPFLVAQGGKESAESGISLGEGNGYPFQHLGLQCSTPGLPVHHQLLELIQNHVHQVSDAIQPPHPLSTPSPPAFNVSHARVTAGPKRPHLGVCPRGGFLPRHDEDLREPLVRRQGTGKDPDAGKG